MSDEQATMDTEDAIFRQKSKLPMVESNSSPLMARSPQVFSTLFTLTKEDLDNPALHYDVSSSEQRGVCLLFNQNEFSSKLQQSKRDGTDMDADAIEKVFRALGYDVRRYHNATAEQYAKGLGEIRKMDHSQHDSFVCVILSHGTNGYIYAYDQAIFVDDVVSQFRGDICPSLIGKPKLFFIQACRGSDFDRGAQKLVSDDAGDKISYKLPVEADVLVANSTFPGYFAWRNSREGSWFIQELCNVLRHDFGAKTHHDIVTLMTSVARRVACLYESNTGQSQSHKMKQMTSFSSTLTKLCYLTGLPPK